uniref:Uncharacterized protein n=1 Tax=Romanomermis culicivorax TaxID=13658 RepID=A0A915HQ38_ROMCU
SSLAIVVAHCVSRLSLSTSQSSCRLLLSIYPPYSRSPCSVIAVSTVTSNWLKLRPTIPEIDAKMDLETKMRNEMERLKKGNYQDVATLAILE